MEIWKDIVGYEGLYMISNMGRVKKLNSIVTQVGFNGVEYSRRFKERLIGQNSGKENYQMIHLRKDGLNKAIRTHRLVAIAFIPNTENKPEVNHINGIKSDNRVENLEWCTSSENQFHSVRTGLSKIQYGSETTNSKLTEKDVLKIRELKQTTKMNNTEIGKLFGVKQPAISKIIYRKNWKHI